MLFLKYIVMDNDLSCVKGIGTLVPSYLYSSILLTKKKATTELFLTKTWVISY